jgi:hypothetical protein
MKKLLWTSAIIAGAYLLLRWDYHVSNYMFERLCNDDSRIGLFVYEEVALGGEYFMPFPEDAEERDLDRRFIFGDNLMLNRERLEEDYEFIVNEVGPIGLVATSVILKSDNKILGKAVSAGNQQGWLNRLGAFDGIPGASCPSGRDENGFSNNRKNHDNLLREVIQIEQI